MRRGSLPDQARADVRPLLPLHLVPDRNRQRVRDQCSGRERRGRNAQGVARTGDDPVGERRGQQVWRCPDCQVALWSNYGGATDVLRFVRVGTLDAPGEVEPDIHIYTRSKLPWVRLPEGALAVEAYYDSKELWPAESLERRKVLFG